jgi:hypothetical protein
MLTHANIKLTLSSEVVKRKCACIFRNSARSLLVDWVYKFAKKH